jgi:CelD/BcsL family acetyltransferase involved in cellulose biosynthesis
VKSRFGANLRANIDRYVRRIQKQHKCEFSRVQTLEQVDEFMEAFVRLHQERWQSKGQRGAFALTGFKDFMCQTVREAFRSHRARLWMLILDGRCVGTLQAFIDRGVAHYFQGGFASGYEKYHLGSVMLALAIQDCLNADDVDVLDLMGGGGSYKRAWTTTAHEAVQVEIMNSRVMFFVYRCVRSGREQLSRLYRSILPGSLQSAIRKHYSTNT